MQKVSDPILSPAPIVSVLMSVYNGAPYLTESIRSVLEQTFTGFEFLVFDDGSTDESVAIIQGFSDPRIYLVRNRTNIGLSESLNIGLGLARGKYVARMDHDDVCLPERLSRQVAFMEAHPEIGICGTWVETIGNSAGQIWKHPTDSDTINCTHIFGPALVHPSFMIRKEMLDECCLFYDPSFKRAQDFDYLVRASQYTSLANIGEVLLRYRLHTQQVGQMHNEEQFACAGKVRLGLLLNLGITPTAEEFNIHQSISSWRFNADQFYLDKVEIWLCRLIDANKKAGVYPEKIFFEILCRRWLEACYALTELGPRTFKKYLFSPLSCKMGAHWYRRVSFFINCLLWRRGMGANVAVINK